MLHTHPCRDSGKVLFKVCKLFLPLINLIYIILPFVDKIKNYYAPICLLLRDNTFRHYFLDHTVSILQPDWSFLSCRAQIMVHAYITSTFGYETESTTSYKIFLHKTRIKWPISITNCCRPLLYLHMYITEKYYGVCLSKKGSTN